MLFFGLCNSSTLFQYYINNILQKYLDIFCTIYFDDVLIYNNFLYKHGRHIKIILERLRSIALFLDVIKYEFHIIKILCLGFIISTHSIKINSAKIKTILKWLQSTCLKDVQSFLEFANFY